MADESTPEIRGLLIHVTHYDPIWYKVKEEEKPFDADVAIEVIEAAAEGGLNLLVVDCADGVKYASHPELERHYTVPMETLRPVIARAGELGLELVPKLNFSQSRYHHHNDWFRPHHELFDSDEYWKLAFEIVDELIEEMKPPRFFHIGMDEDHDRSHRQYNAAIWRAHDELKSRGLRTVIWNDSVCKDHPRAEHHAEKSMQAEADIPKDLVEVVWNYSRPAPEDVERLIALGFEVWGGPGRDTEQVRAWRDDILRLGGKGLLLTRWVPMVADNRDELVGMMKELAPVTKGG